MDKLNQLLQSCEDGDLRAIKYFIERVGVDVNITACFRPRYMNCKLVDATPLFLAARGHHLNVCQYLVDKGANVNALTTVNLSEGNVLTISPLHNATEQLLDHPECLKGKEMIKFLLANGAELSAFINYNGISSPLWTFCLRQPPSKMMTLIDLDLITPSLTWCPVKGRTLLHHWAVSGEDTVPMFKKLLAKGADVNVFDKFGLTPLNVAAMGYSDYLGSLGNPNDIVLRYLLHERDDICLSDKIEALELAGASLLLFKSDERSITRAFQFWYEAQDLRDSTVVPITKAPLNPDNVVHWRSTEWATREELEQLQRRPLPELKMQAFLVTRRFLTRICSSALIEYLWAHFTHEHCWILLDNIRPTELLEVCWLMLEGTGNCDDPSNDHYMKMIYRVNRFLFWSLSRLKLSHNPVLNSETWKISLKLALESTNASQGTHALNILCELVALLTESPEIITPDIKSLVKEFVKQDTRICFGFNLLIAACYSYLYAGSYPSSSSITLATISFLLEVGSDPNATTGKTGSGWSPLHLAASCMRKGEMHSPLADLLLENGAHLDQPDNNHRTPLDVWRLKHAVEARRELSPPAWMNPVIPLTCCCARLIRRSNIPFKVLPISLGVFVSKH